VLCLYLNSVPLLASLLFVVRIGVNRNLNVSGQHKVFASFPWIFFFCVVNIKYFLNRSAEKSCNHFGSQGLAEEYLIPIVEATKPHHNLVCTFPTSPSVERL